MQRFSCGANKLGLLKPSLSHNKSTQMWILADASKSDPKRSIEKELILAQAKSFKESAPAETTEEI